MYRVYLFDRKTAWVDDNGVLHGEHVEVARSRSQKAVFTCHVDEDILNPNEYGDSFVLVVETKRGFEPTYWFFDEAVYAAGVAASRGEPDEVETRQGELIRELGSRRGETKPGIPGIRVLPERAKAAAISQATVSLSRDPAEAIKNGPLLQIVAEMIVATTNYSGTYRVHLRDVEIMPGAHLYRAAVIPARQTSRNKPDPRSIPHDLYASLYAAIDYACDYTGRVWVAFEDVAGCPDCGKGYMLDFMANGDESTLRHYCDPVPRSAFIPGPYPN